MQPGAAFTAPPAPYIAAHDTTPQQIVQTDPTSILIRALQSRKAKEEAKRKAKAAGALVEAVGRAVGRRGCCSSLGLCLASAGMVMLPSSIVPVVGRYCSSSSSRAECQRLAHAPLVTSLWLP